MQKPIKRLVTRVVRSRYLTPLGPPLLRATHYVLGLTNREVIHLGQASRKQEAARIRAIVTGFSEQTVGVDEAYMLRSAVLAAAVVPGALAEVGVFRGGTARVICDAKGDRPLHLFDTFAGLPQPGEH
ncbi:MAG TPA: TylF/MycF/NovP-related O-methyltransferase, partial [Longimicrobiales bacterium]